MTAQEPRIAPMWSDWSPNIAGSVVTTFGRDLSSSQLDTLNVQWTDVPRFSQGATQNTFGTLLYLDSHAFFPGDIDMFSTQFQGTDTGNLMGISPGGGAAGASQSLNVPSIVGASNEALFWFGGTADCTNPTDMAGSYGWFTPTGADTYDWILALAPPAPVTASGIVPDSGPDTGGTSVTITGKNFNALSPLGVEFGLGNPATNVVLVDPCTITCDTPAGPAGPVDVIVTDGSTSATLSGGYTYVPAGSFSGTFTLGDDGSANYVFNNGSFTFYGVLRTDIWVNANGNLTFNSADSDFSESPLEMLSDQPRIAIFWDDIHPGVGGSVGFLEDLNGVNFSYDNVPAYTTGDNTGSATLTYASGNIGLAWGTCTSFNGTVSARNCIAGISPGGSLGAQLAVDFGSTGTTSGASNEALFMWYNDGTGIPWNIDGKSATLAPTGLDSYDAIMP
jgi:hypothetical protein